MGPEVLDRTARLVIARNVTGRVVTAGVHYSASTRRLTITYLTDGPPTDDEEDYCEIAAAELLGDFPEILQLETLCAEHNAARASALANIVYRRA